MDPLSIVASVAGILKAIAEIIDFLKPFVLAAKDTPKIAIQMHAEVGSTRIVLSALQTLTQTVNSTTMKHAGLISVDHLIAVLTDGVLLFSEIENSLGSLSALRPTDLKLSLRFRLQWARKETVFTSLLVRLQGFKNSASLILNILQSDSDLRAEQQREELSINVNTLLESNRDISRRLMNLEDTFDVGTLVIKRQSILSTNAPAELESEQSTDVLSLPTIAELSSNVSMLSLDESLSSSDFNTDLESSRVYRRAQRDTMDFSFRSSIAESRAWSVFSGLSLGQISRIAVIALPIYPEDLTNPEHYDFGEHTGRLKHPKESPRIDQSIFFDCMETKAQLSQIPEILDIIQVLEETSGLHDPLSSLKGLLSLGYPLLIILNEFELEVRWDIDAYDDPANQVFRTKLAIFNFLAVCEEKFGLANEEIPTYENFVSRSNSKFIKIIPILQFLLHELTNVGRLQTIDIQRLIPKYEPPEELISAELITEEFLMSERAYTNNLKEFLTMKDVIGRLGLLSQREWQSIFELIPTLIDSQIDFLIGVEMNMMKDTDDRTWTKLSDVWSRLWLAIAAFLSREEDFKQMLRSSIARHNQNNDGHIIQPLVTSLRFIALPSHHLPKYGQFLENLLGCNISVGQKGDIQSSIKSVQIATRAINEEIRKKQHEGVVRSLTNMVVDWKGHEIERFGSLLVYDELNITNTLDLPPNMKKGEEPIIRMYQVYLFERILLCCKKISSTPVTRKAFFRRPKIAQDDGTTKYELKGRVFVQNITDVKLDIKPGSNSCQVFWKGLREVEFFVMLFSTETQANIWHTTLNRQRSAWRDNERRLQSGS